MTRMTWDEFRTSKLLWACNRWLHLFGVTIVLETDESGEVVDVYPARVSYRGFSREVEEEGFTGLHGWLADNITAIKAGTDS